MERISDLIKGDRTIWIVVVILSIFSVLAVYSSTGTLAYKYQQGNTEYYLLKHFAILITGLVLMYLAHNVKYTYYSRVSQLLIWIAVPLLIITLFMGTTLNQAPRWLTLPVVGITFQTSDLAKLALIMFVARLLSKKQSQIKDLKSAFLPIIFPVLLVCGLILPANLSTAAVLFMTCICLMFIGRVKMQYLLSLMGIGIVGLCCVVGLLMLTPSQGRLETWKNRIEHFVSGDTEGNYQVQQSKIAIAKGGWLGVGPGNSTQRNFLPHPYSDFIFAIIIEEYGFLGATVIILMYLILLFRTIRIVSRSPGAFGTLLAMGCCLSLVFQAMINMAVAVNLFPVTGMTLPLVSMGGTSILFTSIALGIILSVSKSTGQEDTVAPKGRRKLAMA
ncbi:MAG TPA: cell division protein FtsW [Flavobacteriales bacterium]|nr:cell division protein FtsW [Flavobacteriales bacterium]